MSLLTFPHRMSLLTFLHQIIPSQSVDVLSSNILRWCFLIKYIDLFLDFALTTNVSVLAAAAPQGTHSLADQGSTGGNSGACQKCPVHRGEHRPQVFLAHQLLWGEAAFIWIFRYFWVHESIYDVSSSCIFMLVIFRLWVVGYFWFHYISIIALHFDHSHFWACWLFLFSWLWWCPFR